jgi:hypothetical protein
MEENNKKTVSIQDMLSRLVNISSLSGFDYSAVYNFFDSQPESDDKCFIALVLSKIMIEKSPSGRLYGSVGKKMKALYYYCDNYEKCSLETKEKMQNYLQRVKERQTLGKVEKIEGLMQTDCPELYGEVKSAFQKYKREKLNVS